VCDGNVFLRQRQLVLEARHLALQVLDLLDCREFDQASGELTGFDWVGQV
jgi:hypothetical protein